MVARSSETRGRRRRLVINGSFVTDVLEPNDVDCALSIGPSFPEDKEAEAELLAGFPFLEDLKWSRISAPIQVETFVATDRHRHHMAMIEVPLSS